MNTAKTVGPYRNDIARLSFLYYSDWRSNGTILQNTNADIGGL